MVSQNRETWDIPPAPECSSPKDDFREQLDREEEDIRERLREIKDKKAMASAKDGGEAYRSYAVRTIAKAIDVEVRIFTCYPGDSEHYRIVTARGQTHIKKVDEIATWGEAKKVFMRSDRILIPRLSPKGWDTICRILLSLIEDADLGSDSSTVGRVTEIIKGYLYESYRVISFYRDRKGEFIPRDAVLEHDGRIHIFLTDLCQYIALHHVDDAMTRDRVKGALYDMGAKAVKLHYGPPDNRSTRDYWALPPECFRVPQYDGGDDRPARRRGGAPYGRCGY